MDENNDNYTMLDHTFTDRFKDDEEVKFKFRFKKPSAAAVERCQAKAAKKPGMAFRNFCIGCIHAEDKQSMLDAFDEYPGLPTTFGSALLADAGFGDLGN